MQRKIILASKSWHRDKLLRQIGLQFEVRESRYEEEMTAKKNPYKLAKYLAYKKAEDVARHYKNAIVIGADTFVIFKGKFIGKPKNKREAGKILSNLSGCEHEIISGFAIIDTKRNKTITGFGKAWVKFRKLTKIEIEDYISTGEPLTRAGAYGLMDKGAVLIDSTRGDFYSVIGIPLNKIYIELKKLGINTLKQ